MECYLPEENIWYRLRELSMPRSGLASCVVQGLFYAIGGRNNNPDGSYDSAACDRYTKYFCSKIITEVFLFSYHTCH